MTLSRQTGKIKLVENGKIYANKISQDIVKFMNKINVQVAQSKKMALDTRICTFITEKCTVVDK